MADYMPIVDPLLIRRRRGEPFRRAHAWSEGSDHVACGKRVGERGWIVDAVPWATAPSRENVRCPECVIAVEGRRLWRADHGA
jgi:hypothetical protein